MERRSNYAGSVELKQEKEEEVKVRERMFKVIRNYTHVLGKKSLIYKYTHII